MLFCFLFSFYFVFQSCCFYFFCFLFGFLNNFRILLDLSIVVSNVSLCITFLLVSLDITLHMHQLSVHYCCHLTSWSEELKFYFHLYFFPLLIYNIVILDFILYIFKITSDNITFFASTMKHNLENSRGRVMPILFIHAMVTELFCLS